MRSKIFKLYHNRGLLLIAFGVIAILWLRVTSQLNLYIHPRYYVFSVVMSVLTIIIIVGATLYPAHTHSKKIPRRNLIASFMILLVSFAILIVIKPASLSSDIAGQRGVNSGANTEAIKKLNDIDVVSPFGNNSTNQLSVSDWASLLSQTGDANFFAGKQASVTGFITPGDTKDSFYVSRFVVSCCTVDARPVGVPVYKPGWQTTFANNDWVEVNGTFQVKNGEAAVHPDTAKKIPKPKEEYVY